jgi:hypothetical protein
MARHARIKRLVIPLPRSRLRMGLFSVSSISKRL